MGKPRAILSIPLIACITGSSPVLSKRNPTASDHAVMVVRGAPWPFKARAENVGAAGVGSRGGHPTRVPAPLSF
jgi:hypothetical protein